MKWISVEDKLPSQHLEDEELYAHRTVLVSLENGCVCEMWWDAWHQKFYRMEGLCKRELENNPIVAWMEMPETYSKEKEEGSKKAAAEDNSPYIRILHILRLNNVSNFEDVYEDIIWLLVDTMDVVPTHTAVRQCPKCGQKFWQREINYCFRCGKKVLFPEDYHLRGSRPDRLKTKEEHWFPFKPPLQK